MHYILLFALGAVLGAAINCFVDRYCWIPRFRSPWRVWPKTFIDKLNAVDLDAAERGVAERGVAERGVAERGVAERKTQRRHNNRDKQQRQSTRKATQHPASVAPFAKSVLDFVPIFGFWNLRRIGLRLEAMTEEDRLPGLENRWFWLRPFAVELLAAFGLCLMFGWEVRHQMLLPDGLAPETFSTLLPRYAVHVVFFALLLAASLIDVDDMIIPDNLTIFGTLFALSVAWIAPQTALPSPELHTEIFYGQPAPGSNPMQAVDFQCKKSDQAVPLHLNSPASSSILFGPGFFDTKTKKNIAIMGGLWLFWCFAMLPRVWYFRLPFRKAAAIFCRYLRRSPETRTMLWIAVVFPLFGCAMPIAVFSLGERNLWPETEPQMIGLYSALVGMAVGMAIIWATRIIGSVVLGREAMGFGDVTLMGMIGAFVGWQNCILIFFMAPLVGVVLWVFNAAVGRWREFPYGPFLCLASAVLVVFWKPIWAETAPYYYELGWWIGLIMTFCLIMLGVLLGLWRWLRSRLFDQSGRAA